MSEKNTPTQTQTEFVRIEKQKTGQTRTSAPNPHGGSWGTTPGGGGQDGGQPQGSDSDSGSIPKGQDE